MGKENDYLKYVSAEKQWEIMCMVINVYGNKSSLITKMVKDGYPVTIELIELLYRLRSEDVIRQILSYDESLYSDVYLESAKMNLLKKVFGNKEAVKIREDIIKRRDNKLQKEQEIERNQLDEKLDKLYNEFGFSDEFFARISKSKELFKRALHKFDKIEILKGMNKVGVSDGFFLHVGLNNLMKAGLYNQVLSFIGYHNSDEQALYIKQIARTRGGIDLIFNFNKSSLYEAMLHLGKDSSFKEALKGRGLDGYKLLFDCDNLTIDEYEELCEMDNSYVYNYYKQYNKSFFWALKMGYLRDIAKYFRNLKEEFKRKKRC